MEWINVPYAILENDRIADTIQLKLETKRIHIKESREN